MKTLILTTLLLSLTNLGATGPTPTPPPATLPSNNSNTSSLISRWGCRTILPTIVRVNEARPYYTYSSTNVVLMSQDADHSNRIDTFIEIRNVPETAYTCQLQVVFPPNYPIRTYGGGAAQVHVYSTVKSLSWEWKGSWRWWTTERNWRYCPAGTERVGTVSFGDGTALQGMTKGVAVVPCKQVTTFRLAMSRDSVVGGRVWFEQREAVGWRLVHSC